MAVATTRSTVPTATIFASDLFVFLATLGTPVAAAATAAPVFFKPLFFDKFNLKYSKIQNLILRREIFVYGLTKNTFFSCQIQGKVVEFQLK